MAGSQRARQPAGAVTIKGSSRRALAGARMVGAAESTEPIRLSLYARQNPASRIERARVTAELSRQFPKQRHYLKGEAFDSIFGADPEDVKRIKTWAARKGFKVLDSNPANRRISVEGDVPTINQAFGTSLSEYEQPMLGRFRGREGPLRIDHEMYGLVEGVFGLDTRPTGRPRRRRLDTVALPWRSGVSGSGKRVSARALPANPFPGTFFPPRVADLYKYPSFTGS